MNHNMNTNTAGDIIGNVRKLLDGERYTRTNNAYATDYYLDRIWQGFGADQLEQALGAVAQHIDYYEALRGTRLHLIQAIHDKYRAVLAHGLPNLEDVDRQLAVAVEEASALPSAIRQLSIPEADHLPHRYTGTSTVYVRSPHVIAEVLERASGKCESCGQPAPFLRTSNGTPYLEIHHIVMLAKGGVDTPQNAQALCPNCHRRMHYGQDT